AGMVGEQPYIYPTIIADDYHMWRKQEVYDVNTYFFNYHTGWYSPFYRFNGPWMYPQFNHSRVIRYKNAPSKATLPSKSSRTKSNMKPTIQPAKINKEK
ncbi:MAG: starvation-inducible protein, partial [Pseudomonadota bacterium]|nr:starvation-inducible protein [Pseudomonadota bacterium]